MKLLVVTQYFWPENFRINDLVTELANKGHEITVLTGLPNYPDGAIFSEYANNREYYSEYNGVKIIRVPIISRGNGGLRLVMNYVSFVLSATTIGLWRLRGKKFDAVFSFEPSPITVALPAIAIRAKLKIPFVFWVLDLWPETLHAIGVVRSKIVLAAVGKLVSYIYKRCDLILAQSNSFIPQIKHYAGENSWVEYYPSWSERQTDLVDVTEAPEVEQREGVFSVVFTGNIGNAQDFPAILKAAQILKQYDHIRWLIVGDGRNADWVREEIQRCGLQDKVIMLGRHPVERMPSFFKHAQALLVSLKDKPIFGMTIPGKLQSYLAAGVPIIGMLNGEGADIIKNSNAGLSCNAGDYKALAEAILTLSEMSAEERHEMAKNGLSLSHNEFNRENLIGKLEQWLETTSFNEVKIREQSREGIM